MKVTPFPKIWDPSHLLLQPTVLKKAIKEIQASKTVRVLNNDEKTSDLQK